MTEPENPETKPGPETPADAPAPAAAETPAPATEAAAPAAGAAAAPADQPGPAGMPVPDELQAALEEAAASLEGRQPEPEAFDPNRVAPVEPAPAGPSKKEMELKLQILELRAALREKDKEIEQRLKEVRQNAELARQCQSQLEGYKGRTQKEKADWFNYGFEPVLKELLSVEDNLERALAHKEADGAAIIAGVEMIHRQLLSLLNKFGVTQLSTVGQPFNPELHQAMSQVENDGVDPNTVVEEFQKGYKLKDRLLRPAMVLVSRRSEPSDGGAKDQGA